jgi:hypothetical protein
VQTNLFWHRKKELLSTKKQKEAHRLKNIGALKQRKYRMRWPVPKTCHYIGEDRPYIELVTHHRQSEMVFLASWTAFRAVRTAS